MEQLKVNYPPEERPSTSVSTWLNFILALMLTIGMLSGVYHMNTKSFARDLMLGQKGHGGHGKVEATPHEETWLSSLNLNWERTIFQGLTLLMWAMSAVCICIKFVKVHREKKVLRQDLVPEGLNMRDIPSLIELHAKLMAHKQMGKTIVLTRLGRVLSMWINTEDFERTSQYAKQENEMDIYTSDSSFRANRLYIWAMPLLGFVGTVYGVSYGIGGFADFLRGQVTSEEIKYQVGLITEGLAVAFYCTLLGLLTAGVAAFPSLAGEKKEEELLTELDATVEDRLVSRMPSVRKTEFPKEDIQAMREGIEKLDVNVDSDALIDAIRSIKVEFPMDELMVALRGIKLELPVDELTRAIDEGFRRLPNPDRYEVVFTKAIDQASDLVRGKYEEFATSYEHRILELGAGFNSQLNGVATTIQAGSNNVAAEIRGQATGVVEQLKAAAAQMEQTSAEYARRVDVSSQALAQQVARVTEIGQRIDSLLKAADAMDSALKKVQTTEEFGRTLAQIRTHLEINDAFVERMTKPRKIVLQEEHV